jgi:hypothetical protein
MGTDVLGADKKASKPSSPPPSKQGDPRATGSKSRGTLPIKPAVAKKKVSPQLGKFPLRCGFPPVR